MTSGTRSRRRIESTHGSVNLTHGGLDECLAPATTGVRPSTGHQGRRTTFGGVRRTHGWPNTPGHGREHAATSNWNPCSERRRTVGRTDTQVTVPPSDGSRNLPHRGGRIDGTRSRLVRQVWRAAQGPVRPPIRRRHRLRHLPDRTMRQTQPLRRRRPARRVRTLRTDQRAARHKSGGLKADHGEHRISPRPWRTPPCNPPDLADPMQPLMVNSPGRRPHGCLR